MKTTSTVATVAVAMAGLIFTSSASACIQANEQPALEEANRLAVAVRGDATAQIVPSQTEPSGAGPSPSRWDVEFHLPRMNHADEAYPAMTVQDLNWRAAMVASLLGSNICNLSQYRVVAPDFNQSDQKFQDFRGGRIIVNSTGVDRLHSLNRSEAGRQMDSTAVALKKYLPQGSVERVETAVVPLDIEANAFAVAFDVVTPDVALLKQKLLDVMLNPLTGLVAGVDPFVDGARVRVIGNDGRILIADWSTAQGGGTAEIATIGLDDANLRYRTFDVPNLTGGPTPGRSRVGGGVPRRPQQVLRATLLTATKSLPAHAGLLRIETRPVLARVEYKVERMQGGVRRVIARGRTDRRGQARLVLKDGRGRLIVRLLDGFGTSGAVRRTVTTPVKHSFTPS